MAGSKKQSKIVQLHTARSKPSIRPGSLIMVNPKRGGTVTLIVFDDSPALRKFLKFMKGIKPKE